MDKKIEALKIYRLFRKKCRYPEAADFIDTAFLQVLEQKGVISREEIHRETLALEQKEGEEDTAETRQEILESLIDYYAANYLTPAEIENYINLARKREKAEALSVVANRDQANSEEIVKALEEFTAIPQGEVLLSHEEAVEIRVALISRLISTQLPFISLAKNHITIRDIGKLLQRTVLCRTRPGRLGGKAAGMILAHKILLPTLGNRDPELENYIRVPESWYIDSGILSEFLDRNHLYLFHSFKYKDRETIEKEFVRIEDQFRAATFAPEIVEQFRQILNEVGEHPIILRSSSLLEDSFGLAFSGKYRSVFLTNQEDAQTRLKKFMDGLKTVFASTFGPDPILYRMDHGLLDFDERMAIVVQKVVGRRYGDYFFPWISGVLYSRNVYAWNPKIRKEEGLGRIVMGLGTRAVDRVGDDYPRLVALSHPLLRPEVTAGQIKKYSQKQVDVLNLRKGVWETVDFRTLAAVMPSSELFYAVSMEKDDHLAPPMFKGQELTGNLYLTLDNLLQKTDFVPLAKKILSRVESAYGHPVDMEFALDEERFYILQCRFLATRKDMEKVSIPENIPGDRTLFRTRSGLSNSIVSNLEFIVYVNPRAYDALSTFEEKMEIARAVNALNKLLGGKRFVLMGPGRWGSNDINLGVRVTYADINKAKVLIEVAFAKEGYTPEVSYGTHFFQDLVEADIVIAPLFPDDPDGYLNETFLLGTENLLAALAPDLKNLDRVVRVIHVPSGAAGQFLHVYLDMNSQRGLGFFGPREKE